MAHNIDKIYQEAVDSGLLPGISVMAGDKNGNIIYSKSIGVASQKAGRDLPFTASNVCALASMSKLMTSVAVLQCVEDGKLDLDSDVKPLLPEIGKYDIITGFDDEKNSAVLEESTATITLWMLLSHTSGHEYDWFGPLLAKWRASRAEELWTGPTVENKSVLHLVFRPGTSFAYGAGHDWAGKLVELFLKSREYMTDRIANISTLNEKGEPPAVNAATFDILYGGTDCLGGGGLLGSTEAYHTFVSAVLRRDSRLLKPGSYEELFRPQLDERQEEEFNKYIARSPMHTSFLGMAIPLSIRRIWSFAGMVVKEGETGRFAKGMGIWGGVPSVEWFIDHETGLCATMLDLRPITDATAYVVEDGSAEPEELAFAWSGPPPWIRKTFLENPDSVMNQNELYASSKTVNCNSNYFIRALY
ncbi:hypothetical protein PG994_009812 [Apiospora phragmitis]|uniref:Beta-lactamase-related domain-containing protein n=1 Tax=Apiospora phragmitis TaxID=2905665 RepID=A0ABR1U7A2_9PEZI